MLYEVITQKQQGESEMAYTRGNLAVKEKTATRGQNPRYRETTKVVTRRSPLPIREKLLYMVTILFCVGIMGGLLWQNSQLYDISYNFV